MGRIAVAQVELLEYEREVAVCGWRGRAWGGGDGRTQHSEGVLQHRRVGGAPVRFAQGDPQVGETAGEQLGAGWCERDRLSEHSDGRRKVGVAALDPGTPEQ